MPPVETSLLNAREQFLGYIRAKVSDPDLAEDILQDSLLKALRAAPGLREEDKLIPWFYRILHNAIIDTYRRREVDRRAIKTLSIELASMESAEEDEEGTADLCQCLREIIPTLRPEYADLINSELAEENSQAVASRLGITLNNLKVRRHRARQALRQRLEETCRICAEHGCVDCTCR